MAEFIVLNNTVSDVVVDDLSSLTVPGSAELDLALFFSLQELANSSDLVSLINATTLSRLDGPGGSPISSSQAFDDANISDHNNDADAHGLSISILQNVTDAGSGQIISSAERTKLSGIEAGAEVNDTASEIETKLNTLGTVSIDVDTVDGQDAADLLSRSNHTGTQTASTISDFNTEVDSRADARISVQKGAANGLASLDGSGRIPSSQLTLSAFEFQGNWNANTNTPTLTSSTGTQGDTYRVSVAGTTNLDGITDWEVGDQVVFDGSVWVKFDNSDSVISVNSQTGAVVLDTDDVSEGSTNLYYTDVRVSANSDVVANTAKVSADGSIDTHSDVDTTSVSPSSGDLLVWDGSNWAPQAPPGEDDLITIQVRRATTFTVPNGSYSAIVFSDTDVANDTNILARDATNNERINILDGTHPVFITHTCSIDKDSDGEVDLRARLNGSTVINGSVQRMKATGGVLTDASTGVISSSFVIPASSLSGSDYVTIEAQGTGGTPTIEAGATTVAIQLKGPKGEKGDPGSGTQITVENDDSNLGNFSVINLTNGLQATDAGSGQADLTFEPQILYLGKSSSQNFSGVITVNYNRSIRTNASLFTVNTVGGGTEVTFNFTGEIEVSYNNSCDNISGGRESSRHFIELNTGSGFSTVDDSDSYGYHRNSANGEDTSVCSDLPISVSSGDVLRVRADDITGGTLSLLPNGCRLKIQRIS